MDQFTKDMVNWGSELAYFAIHYEPIDDFIDEFINSSNEVDPLEYIAGM